MNQYPPKVESNDSSYSRQLYPIQVNAVTREPFMRLPAPHNRIIITPPRLSDLQAVVATLNDPKMYHWMVGLPYPYLPDHGVSWITQEMTETDAILRDLYEADANGPLKIALGCPLRIIREVSATGADTYLGYLGVYRPETQDVLGNATNGLGGARDSEMIWDLANYIVSSRHGQGIMTAALNMIIDNWLIPRSNVYKIQASVLEGNVASVKVLQKVGFTLRGVVETRVEAGGGSRRVQWLEWNRGIQS